MPLQQHSLDGFNIDGEEQADSPGLNEDWLGDGLAFEDYRDQWMSRVQRPDQSQAELGQEFAQTLMSEWLGYGQDHFGQVLCDGGGAGGIALAYFEPGQDQDVAHNEHSARKSNEMPYDQWLLVQTEFGTASGSGTTLLQAARAVVDILRGNQPHRSSISDELLQRLLAYVRNRGPNDRVVLVYATVDALTEDQAQALNQIRELGRRELGPWFDTDAVSVRTIYNRLWEPRGVRVPLQCDLRWDAQDERQAMAVGLVSLNDWYQLLQNYRAITRDLSRLSSGVGRGMGWSPSVNAGILQTLKTQPELMGYYHNGITVVARQIRRIAPDVIELLDPWIVDGLHTIQMLWLVGRGQETGEAHAVFNEGQLLTKLMQIGDDNDDLRRNIIHSTNMQHTEQGNDYVALRSLYATWQREMAQRYGLFLEIQGGSWVARKAWQEHDRLTRRQLQGPAVAFELMKVVGAGWLVRPGLALSSNLPFLVGGEVFNALVAAGVGCDEFYVASKLREIAVMEGFVDDGQAPMRQRSRSVHTRYLFYAVLIELLRRALAHMNKPATFSDVTRVLLVLVDHPNSEPLGLISYSAATLIDSYIGGRLDQEPAYIRAGGNLNDFLGADTLAQPNQCAAYPALSLLLDAKANSLTIRARSDIATFVEQIKACLDAIAPTA